MDFVLGARKIEELDEILDRELPHAHETLANELFRNDEVSDFVSVMRGCDNYCAYCIVPYVRGPEKSIPAESIERTVRKRADDGIKEITLLGQNVNSYNDRGTDFSDLLVKIASIDGLERVRFTTSHPKDCSEKLISTIASEKKLCRHIHLPVQAGSDRILSLMNRKYTRSHYLDLVGMIRSYLPDVDITTDILVGFPGETEEEFLETLDLVKKVRYTTAFMFAYSKREGTKAANMSDSVSKDEKLSRLSRLIEVQTAITKETYEEALGKELTVMVNGRQQKRDRSWMGQDMGCKRVLLPCEGLKSGMILKARAVQSSGMTLICERI